ADLLEAAAVVAAQPDQDPAVALAQDARRRLPLSRGVSRHLAPPCRGAAPTSALAPSRMVYPEVSLGYREGILSIPSCQLGERGRRPDGEHGESPNQLPALLPGGAGTRGDRGEVVAPHRPRSPGGAPSVQRPAAVLDRDHPEVAQRTPPRSRARRRGPAGSG